ncbi:MAG: leucyl/phenylalanyl-tRNA--protein transferase [Pseudomonadota bacterium]
MSGVDDIVLEITPTVLLKAYACGIFPMAESSDDPGMFWVEPERRGILPLDEFHVPKSLKKTIRKDRFNVTYDTRFPQVIEACAAVTSERRSTWINQRIITLYCDLFEMGYANSIECWLEGELVGGLYGVRLGRAFFGESMFSRATDASKVALVHLVYQMRKSGFVLLDTQFTTSHLERFGAREIEREFYQEMLDEALKEEAHFHWSSGGATSDCILQSLSQIS